MVDSAPMRKFSEKTEKEENIASSNILVMIIIDDEATAARAAPMMPMTKGGSFSVSVPESSTILGVKRAISQYPAMEGLQATQMELRSCSGGEGPELEDDVA